MPDVGLPSVFMSYSREDSAFVDRLEADLRARGFSAWVDRRGLEGGQQWQVEIDRAIERHSVMVLVLTPASTESDAVAHEYAYANERNKLIIPIVVKTCAPHFDRYPMPQHWIQEFLGDYAKGLKALLSALLFQQLTLNAPIRELYLQATNLKGSGRAIDKELAVVMLQHILDREPNYLPGIVKQELAQLAAILYPIRAQNLRTQTITARKNGDYKVEAGTLEVLLALGHPDPCATEYLPLARQNSQFVDEYWLIQQQIARGNLADAKARMRELWAKAPYYGDPANVAPKLGLALPRSYEEVKARKGAEEQRQREDAAARADLAQKTAQVTSVFARLRELMDRGYSSAFSESTQVEITNLMNSVDASEILQQTSQKTIRYSIRHATDLSRSQRLSQLKAVIVFTVGWIVFSIFAGNAIVLLADNFLTPYYIASSYESVIGLVIVLSAYTPIPLGLAGYILLVVVFRNFAKQAQKERAIWHQKWQESVQHELDQRTQPLQTAADNRISAINTRHQQRIQAIEATYRASTITDPLLTCWQRNTQAS